MKSLALITNIAGASEIGLPTDVTGWSLLAICFAIILFYWRSESKRFKDTEQKLDNLEEKLGEKTDDTYEVKVELEICKVGLAHVSEKLLEREKSSDELSRQLEDKDERIAELQSIDAEKTKQIEELQRRLQELEQTLMYKR